MATVNPITYIKESKTELKKVVWPSRTHTIRMTLAVIIVSIIIGAYVAGIDAILAKLTERFVK